jgi:hypothetical protein
MRVRVERRPRIPPVAGHQSTATSSAFIELRTMKSPAGGCAGRPEKGSPRGRTIPTRRNPRSARVVTGSGCTEHRPVDGSRHEKAKAHVCPSSLR